MHAVSHQAKPPEKDMYVTAGKDMHLFACKACPDNYVQPGGTTYDVDVCLPGMLYAVQLYVLSYKIR